MLNGQSVFYKNEHGLLVPDQAAGDERAIARLLKDYDPDLRLVPQKNGYRVYRYAGSERPAEFILYWGDERGNPYPLSGRILDEVRKLDRNSRAEYKSPEQLNDEHKVRETKRVQTAARDLYDDWKSVHGRIPHMGGVRGKRR